MNPDAKFDRSLKDVLGPDAYEQKWREHEEAVFRQERRRAIRTKIATVLLWFAMMALAFALLLHAVDV